MSAPFQPGDVVVCVDASPRKFNGWWGVADNLTEGGVYRISGVGMHPVADWPVLFLVSGGSPDGSAADRFRKIDDEVTDEFRSMLRNLPVKQGEDA